MANNQGIDFGQSSKIEYSLSSLTAPQEENNNIARDTAQAVQVGSNLTSVVQNEKGKVDQANYFNSVIDFNNNRSDQQKELLDAGMDLNKQREVLDKYNNIYSMIPEKYNLSKQYSAQLGTSIEGHSDGLEEKYRTVFNARRADVAEANVAEAVSTLPAVPNQDAATTLQALKEYYMAETGADPKTASAKVAKNYINAKISSLDPENTTFEQVKALREDLSGVLLAADPTINTDINFREAMHATDRIVERKRNEEEDNLKDVIRTGQVSDKDMNDMIDSARQQGIVISDAQADLYKKNYKNVLLDNAARDEARLYSADEKASRIAMWQMIAGKFNNEDALQTALNTKEFDDLLPWHKAAIMAQFKNTVDKEAQQALKTNDINVSAWLESHQTDTLPDGTVVSSQEYERMLRNMSSNGSLNAEGQKKLAIYKLGGAASADPGKFAGTSLYDYPVAYSDIAKHVANSQIDRAFQNNRMDIVAAISANYGSKGNISTFFESSLEDPAKFQDTYQKYLQLKQALPASINDIVGKENVIKLETINRIHTAVGGAVTYDMCQKAENMANQRIDLTSPQIKQVSDDISSNKISDINGYNESVKTFMRMGKSFSTARDLAKTEFTTNIVGSVNCTGIPNVTINSKQKDLINAGMKVLFEDTHSAINGAIYNKGTGTMWFSLPGRTYAKDTGMNFDQFLMYLNDGRNKKLSDNTNTQK